MAEISRVILLLCLFAYSTGETGWFWHITDLHWDFTYWTQQLSCNGKTISAPGRFGNGWCDSPWNLVNESIKAMRRVNAVPDFILWTGDSIGHIPDSALSIDKNEEMVANITEIMKETFPGVPVYATFGNHDYWPANQYPAHGNQIYNDTVLLWKEWINESSQEENFRKGGYYTVKTGSGIRIIALNTNIYYTSDKITATVPDPSDQLAWLSRVLTDAAANKEKVIITGHVPPGYTTPRATMWFRPNFNKKFNQIIRDHAGVIVAMHFGHEHHDSYRMYYNQSGHPVVPLFIAPSVTPWRYQIFILTEPAHHPGVRLLKYDRQTGKHLDLLQYYIDLPKANAVGSLHWTLGYTATVNYSIPDITPDSLNKLAQRMHASNSSEFKHYVNWYNVNASPNYPCDTRCKKAMICGIRNVEEGPFKLCLNDRVPPEVGKRHEGKRLENYLRKSSI